jgi:hypothetical protein
MIAFMKTHGFWGLVAMAAWPNAAFDLCGICCGTFMMPFWQFFGATFVGKGLIKAPAQGAVFATVFSAGPRSRAVAAVAGAFPASWGVREALTKGVARALDSIDPKGGVGGAAAAAAGAGGSARSGAAMGLGSLSLSAVWGWFITAVIVYFAASCVEQMAQMKQGFLDKAAVDKKHGVGNRGVKKHL